MGGPPMFLAPTLPVPLYRGHRNFLRPETFDRRMGAVPARHGCQGSREPQLLGNCDKSARLTWVPNEILKYRKSCFLRVLAGHFDLETQVATAPWRQTCPHGLSARRNKHSAFLRAMLLPLTASARCSAKKYP